MLTNTELSFILYGALALFVLGLLLSHLARSEQNSDSELLEHLDKALPQAQCSQCGYPGCHAYAQALANHEVACNKCTIGGASTTEALAEILGITDYPLNGEEGADSEAALFSPRSVASIQKTSCTGCGKCKRFCPVDAIEGTHRVPHYINEEECIGCKDCIKACPEHCIEMIRLEPTFANFNWDLHAIRFQNSNNNT